MEEEGDVAAGSRRGVRVPQGKHEGRCEREQDEANNAELRERLEVEAVGVDDDAVNRLVLEPGELEGACAAAKEWRVRRFLPPDIQYQPRSPPRAATSSANVPAGKASAIISSTTDATATPRESAPLFLHRETCSVMS